MTEPKQRRPRPPREEPTDVEDLLSLMREGDSLWFWRRSADGQKWVFLEGRDPEVVRSVGVRESARQRTGGGEYKARIRRPGGQWGEQRGFSIDGPPRSIPSETTTAAAAAPAVTSSAGGALPAWVEKIIIPIGVTLGAGIVDRLLSGPKTDPLVLELIKRNNRGDAIDPIELNKLMLDAETRGETRGKQLGELMAATERTAGASGGDSLVSVMREAAPIFSSLLQQRAALAPVPSPSPAMPATAAPTAPASDIVPAWLRPFMNFKPFVISAADQRHDPRPMGDMVITNATDESWAAIVEAEAAGRLDSDFFAALPELRNTTERLEFAVALLAHIREEIKHQAGAPAASAGA